MELAHFDHLLSGNSSMVKYEDLFEGTQLSDCPLPCTTTHTETNYLHETPDPRNFSSLFLTFSSKVMVTRTDFLNFSLSSFLSEVGGSMGLWLGLGMVQTMELVINSLLPWITRKITK